MKLRLALIVALAGVIALVVAFWVTQPTWNGFLIGISGNLLAVALGILIVNQYMEGDARKRAVRALLILSEQSIAAFHNRWIELCWAKFGRDKYGEIGSEYVSASGNPEALQEGTRREIYNVYKTNSDIQNFVKKLDEALTELSRLAGWSLDPQILEECLKARTSITRLATVSLDDSLESVNAVTEHIFDIDGYTGAARALLMRLAGVTDDE